MLTAVHVHIRPFDRIAACKTCYQYDRLIYSVPNRNAQIGYLNTRTVFLCVKFTLIPIRRNGHLRIEAHKALALIQKRIQIDNFKLPLIAYFYIRLYRILFGNRRLPRLYVERSVGFYNAVTRGFVQVLVFEQKFVRIGGFEHFCAAVQKPHVTCRFGNPNRNGLSGFQFSAVHILYAVFNRQRIF